jgi:glycosyltransferase involved in cell wall biosynthesis
MRKGLGRQSEEMGIKVSVLMVTFNHARFIAQAIESVLSQATRFDFEVVIGEDCSTDGTREIVRSYARAHPEKIRVLSRDRNIGALPNFAETLQACRGEYVAQLDGDDFWTGPGKLQRQADFLDGHPDFSACAHNARVFDEATQQDCGAYCPAGRNAVITFDDLLIHDPVPSSSVMFRRGLFSQLPDWFFTLFMEDWPLYVLNAQHGPMGYDSELMATYRVHEGGRWSAMPPIQRLASFLEVYQCFRDAFGPAYDKPLRWAISRYHLLLAHEHLRSGDSALAWSEFLASGRACRWSPRLLLRRSLYALLPELLRHRDRRAANAVSRADSRNATQ